VAEASRKAFQRATSPSRSAFLAKRRSGLRRWRQCHSALCYGGSVQGHHLDGGFALNACTLPVPAFISYSHRDETFKDRLETQLALMRRQGVVSDWHDRRITAGREWEGEIDEHLACASLILLLISPDFLASDYCYDVEMQKAMDLHEAGEARVIPIMIRPCPSGWKKTPFARLQALPRDARPISEWENEDRAWVDVVDGIEATLADMCQMTDVEENPYENFGRSRPSDSVPTHDVDLRPILDRARAGIPKTSSFGPTLLWFCMAGRPSPAVRPAEFDAQRLEQRLAQLLLFDVGLFQPGGGYDLRREGSQLQMVQEKYRVVVDEEATVCIAQPAEAGPSGLTCIIEEDLRGKLSEAVQVAQGVLSLVDPERKVECLAVAAGLTDCSLLCWRTEAEHAASPNSMTMDHSDGKPILVELPRPVEPSHLTRDRGDIVEDLLVLLRREVKG